MVHLKPFRTVFRNDFWLDIHDYYDIMTALSVTANTCFYSSCKQNNLLVLKYDGCLNFALVFFSKAYLIICRQSR